MLVRFLLLPLPVALLLLWLQWERYFNFDLVGLLVAAPAYVIVEDVFPFTLFQQDGLDVLGLALLGWSSLVLAPWWYPGNGQKALRNKLMLILLPLSFVLQMGTLAWKIWKCLTDFCC
ncbi:hypothetical protein DES53_109249 [Roseimicrobium gellanilyticum]|uniref:Uncharacterized protein n=1 Tax=Roseimicrobium gellanilyticum TaxID=748857 RepID=A0A366HBT2_9BACT|nr:hypothetical protein DES53_109249 [Roseimicrobium gellanilyticum]